MPHIALYPAFNCQRRYSTKILLLSLRNSYINSVLWTSKRNFNYSAPHLSIPSKDIAHQPNDEISASKQEGEQISAEDAKLFKAALNSNAQESTRLPPKAPQKDEKYKKIGDPGVGVKAGELMLAFTCCKCNTRAVKRFSKHSYAHGIVIVQCPGCSGHHLIADNLGWFSDAQKNKSSSVNNIEAWVKNGGPEVQRLNAENLLDIC